MSDRSSVLLIACGALAHEVLAVLRLSDWEGMSVECLPAKLHNRPDQIPERVREKIRAAKPHYSKIFVLYGDCGTGGLLDAVLEEEGVERIAGAHCYEFFAGGDRFEKMADAEPCSFYLTDFLLRHFERLVIQGLGIDRHPELMPMYFGNYTRLVYLAQVPSPERYAEAQKVADRLGLELVTVDTGYGDMGRAIEALRPRPAAALKVA